MKRVIVVSASALALLAGPSVAAQAAQPSTAQASTAQASTAQPATPPPATDTATVCDVSGATVVKGLTDFMKELDKAGAAATSGDIATSQAGVKQSGAMLTDLAGKLRKDVENAQDPELKKAVEDVAKEMEIQGGNLSGDLGSVKNYDSKQIEDLSEKVNEICTR